MWVDFWPLQRVPRREAVSSAASLARLVLEKLPYAALSLGSALVTVAAQRGGGALWSSAEVPLALRLANAAVSTWRYLAKTLWPSDLAALYPHPYIPETGGAAWSAWQVAASLVFLCLVSGALWRVRRRRVLLFGWLWYLTALVPVIGIVQVGAQGIADRYSYVPLIGVFVAAVWGGADGLRQRAAVRAAAALSIGALLVFSALSFAQVRVWRSSIALFEHALALAPGNWILHAHLGDALLEEANPSRAVVKQAAEHYRAVVVIRPEHLEARVSLASLLAQLGRRAEAEKLLREVARLRASAPSAGGP